MPLALETASQPLLNGELGTVRYFPACVSENLAANWFQSLLTSIAWSAQRRQMYDREVDVPRLTAWFELDASELPAPIVQARRIAEDLSAHVFNSVGLNLYRDGRDSVAPHNDKLNDLSKGAPIALLSLGATRRFVLSTKTAPRRRLDLDLEPGSLLLMSYDTQLHLDHSVPKTRTAVGQRISLVFRDRPRPGHSHYAPARRP